MADASFVQSSFLGGQWGSASQGRIDLPEYRTALETSLNGLPLEEGAWTRRSGTRDQGYTYLKQTGQIKEFWLPNNVAVVLEITPNQVRYWAPSDVAGSGSGYTVVGGNDTSYTTVAQCQALRVVQADDTAFFLTQGQSPMALVCTNYTSAGPNVPPVFIFEYPYFEQVDGPYLDPLLGQSQTGNSLGVVDSNTSSLDFTITDGAYSFIASDVGRAIRLWSQPPAWDGALTYTEGQAVSYAGTYWTALVGGTLNTGIPPGAVTQPPSGSTVVPTQAWAISPAQAVWVWGTIVTVTSSTTVVVQLRGSYDVPNLNGYVIDTWQLGLYTANIWPTVGVYHGGRLWLAGAIPNRIDACISNGTELPKLLGVYAPLFSPTDDFGNVLDDSGIAAPLNLSPATTVLWMEPDNDGIVIGTAHSECRLSASALNDPITPTSIQIHKETAYKSQNSEPARAGLAIVFIQSFGRRVMEYVIDVFSRRFIGRHLNEHAKDLTIAGVKKVSYQEELAPTIWAVTNDGNLIGCTYRRYSQFGQEGPVFNGWHQHVLGSDRTVQWICPGTSNAGTEDVLVMLTQEVNGSTHLEVMQRLFDDGDALTDAWFLDSAFSGSQLTATDNGTNYITVHGIVNDFNSNYQVWIGGLYAGTHTSNIGEIVFEYGSDPDQLLTADYLQDLSGDYGDLGVTATIGGQVVEIPIIVGFHFTSMVKLLRPAVQVDVRTPNGPGLAKTRRLHMYGAQLANTITGPLVSVDAGSPVKMNLVAADQQTPLNHATLFSGVHWDTIDDDYSFDGQLTFTQTDPYPLTIAAVSGFIHTQDR